MVLTNRTVTVDGTGALQVCLSDAGSGPPILLFHGGAGPSSVSQFAELLAATARVIVPVHPGFDGTPRPLQLASVRALAGVYTQLIKAGGSPGTVAPATTVHQPTKLTTAPTTDRDAPIHRVGTKILTPTPVPEPISPSGPL